jgi:hypothetical protein
MTAIITVFSRAFSATNEDFDSVFPVLMFTVVGPLLSICLVLAFGAPPMVEFETF